MIQTTVEAKGLGLDPVKLLKYLHLSIGGGRVVR